MIFDQYSRYSACAQLLSLAGCTPEHTVLDAGSGPECLFGSFLAEGQATFADPLIPVGDAERRVKGDVFASALDGRQFDFVVSVDVFEHVAPERREAFLERVLSLARTGVVLGFPNCDASEADAVDRALEAQFEAVYGRQYSWLKEHQEYGLPSLADTVRHLEQRGWRCQAVGHGHAPWLTELLALVIDVLEQPAFLGLVQEISERFNEALARFDFNGPHYRHFIVAMRDVALPPIDLAAGAEEFALAQADFRELVTDARARYLPESLRELARLGTSLREVRLNFAELSGRVSRMEAQRVTAEGRVAALEAALAKRDQEIASLRDTVAMVTRSRSWRLTRPIRFGGRILRHGLGADDKARLGELMRGIFHRVAGYPRPEPSGAAGAGGAETAAGALVRLAPEVPGAPPGPTAPATRLPDKPDYIVWGVIDWHFRMQRPQQIARRLAAFGRRVLYVSPRLLNEAAAGCEVEILDGEGRLFQVRFCARGAPMIYSSAPGIDVLAQLRMGVGGLLEWLDAGPVVSLVQHPFWYDVAAVLPDSRLVYDCMDHHEGFGNTTADILALEGALVDNAELTVVSSAWLEGVLAERAARCAVVRNAAEFEHFAEPPESVYRPPFGRRVIGYYGAIAEWFDAELVEAIARRFPDDCVLLVGADTAGAGARLCGQANVVLTGEVPYDRLPFYLHAFDVCILPFKVLPLTLATNPVKVYEYLSAGKPVVAVDLPEMAQFGGLVATAASASDFIDGVAAALEDDGGESAIRDRKTFAAAQTWARRAEALVAHVEGEAADPAVSVIVVAYNNLHLTKACLDSLERLSGYPSLEVIVVDNASSDGTGDFLREWVSLGEGRKIVLNDANLGFAAANNQGLAAAGGEYLVLLNNDTVVTPGWVRTLVSHLRRDPTIGLIGPVTNNIGNEAKVDVAYAGIEEMPRKAADYTRRHIGQTFALRTAAFFCVMMPRAVYQQVGTLDEQFGTGFFEDDDYCRRVEAAGWRIVCAEDVFVHHHLSATFDQMAQERRQALFERNKALYEAKWGKWAPHVYRGGRP